MGTFTHIFMIIGSSIFCPGQWALSVQGPCVLGSLFYPWCMRKTFVCLGGGAGILIQFLLLQVISLYKGLWDPLWKGNIDKQNIKHDLLSFSILWIGWEIAGKIRNELVHVSILLFTLWFCWFFSSVLVESVCWAPHFMGSEPKKYVWSGKGGRSVNTSDWTVEDLTVH